MGCVISATAPASANENALQSAVIASRQPTHRRLTNIPYVKRFNTLERSSTSRNSNSDFTTSTRRRSSNADRMSGMSFFGNRFSGARSSTGDDNIEASATDPLGLGSDTQAAKAPSQWLVVVGERHSGKSTLIRQLKLAHDGLDIPEALRFAREVHKFAVALFKQVIQEAHQFGGEAEEIRSANERIRNLKRRTLITEEVARDLKLILSRPEVQLAKANLSDVQARKAVSHFASRLDEISSPDYVPEALDLLHIGVPTLGQQETRVQTFPGGSLALIENNNELRRSSTFEGRSSTTQDAGFRGILFVASALSFDDNSNKSAGAGRATSIDHSNKSNVPLIAPKTATLRQWQHACCLAAAKRVPCMLVLSKYDLLSSINLPGGLTCQAAAALLQSQYLEASATIDDTRKTCGPNSSDAKMSEMIGENSVAINLLEDITEFSDTLMRKAFPHLDLEEEVKGLGEAVYLCFTCFSAATGSVISRRGVLPVSKWKAGVLPSQYHVWLNELPSPLPNPRHVDNEVAELMGKNSPDEVRSSFWVAISYLADQLESYDPEFLGILHELPLLTSSGALLLVFRSVLHTDMSLGSHQRHVSWRPATQVAKRIAKVAQAAEYVVNEPMRGTALSYALDVRNMLAKVPARELLPSVWLERLREASVTGKGNQILSGGTYMVGFYTQSTYTGLQILLPQNGLTSIPPFVKISDKTLSAAEWSDLCEMELALSRGQRAKVPDNWADAKGWMGPDVGSEDQYSAIQKFFYGVVALRQRLEVKCNAVRDDLRYSSVNGASDSLTSLGELHKQEIVMADEKGKVQLLIMTKHFSVAETDSHAFPPSLKWHSFPIFEARHYRDFLGRAFRQMCTGKELVLHGTSLNSRLQKLRGSGLHSPASMRGSGSLRASMTSQSSRMASFVVNTGQEDSPDTNLYAADVNVNLSLKTAATAMFDEQGIQKLHDAWEPLRWTKRAVLASVSKCSNEDKCNATPDPGGKKIAYPAYLQTSTSAEQREKQRRTLYHQVLDDLSVVISGLRHNVEELKLAEAEARMSSAEA